MKALLFVGLSVVAFGSSFAGQAQERKITRSQLPPAVEKTVARESQGATIKGFSTEKEKGVRVYEAELLFNDRSKDITIDSNGTILEIEEQVAINALPDTVKNALTKAAGAGTIVKVESLTKSGKLVAYEADVATGKKHREIQVGPNGEKLAHEQ